MWFARYQWNPQGSDWKSIEDTHTGKVQRLADGYAQIGWFASDLLGLSMESLELAVRVAYVDTGVTDTDTGYEYTFRANWVFNDHRNKLTADLSRLKDPVSEKIETRLRLQWGLSL